MIVELDIDVSQNDIDFDVGISNEDIGLSVGINVECQEVDMAISE